MSQAEATWLVVFLAAGLFVRVHRAVEAEAENRWVSLSRADYLGFGALIVLVIGWLLLPTVVSAIPNSEVRIIIWLTVISTALQVAGITLALGYPMALAAHYELSIGGRLGAPREELAVPRGPSRAERWWVLLTVLVACGSAALVALIGRPGIVAEVMRRAFAEMMN